MVRCSPVKWRLFERESAESMAGPSAVWRGSGEQFQSSVRDAPTESDLADWEGEGGSVSRDFGEAEKEPQSGL